MGWVGLGYENWTHVHVYQTLSDAAPRRLRLRSAKLNAGFKRFVKAILFSCCNQLQKFRGFRPNDMCYINLRLLTYLLTKSHHAKFE